MRHSFCSGLAVFHVLITLLFCCQLSSGQNATNQVRPWNEYKAIMWIGDSAFKDPSRISLFFQRLREMGISTGMVHGDGNLKPLLENQFPYYVENIVNRGLCLKWNSKVTDWEKFVTAWAKEGRQEAALVRDYCLEDPAWRDWALNQMRQLVGKNAPHQPLAYDIRDELSTTISANPFDYDFHPLSLAAFRKWLKSQYRDLNELNAEWETQFADWEVVKPFTTDQIKNRMASGDALPRGTPDWQKLQNLKFDPRKAREQPTAWNFSPWADFRTFMDISLAETLNSLRQAAHTIDPQTPVGIEGTQMPHAFGGYDLWRLSQALDWVEPYDIGNAREIFGSFMKGKTLMTTVFEKDTNAASRRLWHLLLEGDRGCIIWWSEDCIDWKSADYELTPKAKALAPVLQHLQSPLARLFLGAERERDPIFLHYSQPSIQVDWLLESTVDGSTWLRRFSSFESEHNQMAKTRNGWVKAFQDLGYSPQFISQQQIEEGKLPKNGGVLVLANSWATSEKETAGIRQFLKGQDNTLFYEGSPGLFDEHGKLRKRGSFDDMAPAQTKGVGVAGGGGSESSINPTLAAGSSASERLSANMQFSAWVASRLRNSTSPVKLDPATRTRVHRFRLGKNRLLAFELNINYQMSEELKQAGGNEPLEKPVKVQARLEGPAHVYDLRLARYLGEVDRIDFELNPWQPALFALAPEKIQGDVLTELAK